MIKSKLLILRLRRLAIIGLAAGACGVACATDTKPAPPDGVTFETNIEYAHPDDQHLALDMARPKEAATPRPAIVCIHGGGFARATVSTTTHCVCSWPSAGMWPSRPPIAWRRSINSQQPSTM